jgi:hypothetical protein
MESELMKYVVHLKQRSNVELFNKVKLNYVG